MPAPDELPPPRQWRETSLTDLGPGLELTGFESPADIDTFSKQIALQMLGLAVYGDITQTDEFNNHPALYTHASRRANATVITDKLTQPVLSHAYSVEDIRLGCVNVKHFHKYREEKIRKVKDIEAPTVKVVRNVAVSRLRSLFTGEIVSAAGTQFSLELFEPLNHNLGIVAVKRSVEPLLFDKDIDSLFPSSGVNFSPDT